MSICISTWEKLPLSCHLRRLTVLQPTVCSELLIFSSLFVSSSSHYSHHHQGYYIQLFFLNYAQIWCGSMRPEDAQSKILSRFSHSYDSTVTLLIFLHSISRSRILNQYKQTMICSLQRAQPRSNQSGWTSLQFGRVCLRVQLQARIQNEPNGQVLGLVNNKNRLFGKEQSRNCS